MDLWAHLLAWIVTEYNMIFFLQIIVSNSVQKH